jgi:hypothetical protein
VHKDRLAIFDVELNRLSLFDSAGALLSDGILPFAAPANMHLALTSNGHLFVAGQPGDQSLPGMIQELDSEYRLVNSFGEPPLRVHAEERQLTSWGSMAAGSDGSVWFAPAHAYEIRRYDEQRLIERVITREHDFAFGAGPQEQLQEIAPGVLQRQLDMNQAMASRIVLDASDRIWLFVRDVPRNRVVLDTYTSDGTFVNTATWMMSEAPGSMDARNRFYRTHYDSGFAQLTRYLPANLDHGGFIACE